MDPSSYPMPAGVHAIPAELLDLRPDSEIDSELTTFRPVRDDKNVWFYWHSGFVNMHAYTQRNVRAWHRRFSKQGWVVRVVDRLPGSPLNVAAFLDVSDPDTFPRAFSDGTIGGEYAAQHTSDLVRFPLILKHGGIYADVGLMQIGDLDALWNKTLGDASSPFEVVSFNTSDQSTPGLLNYFLGARRGNAFFEHCHRLLLALWGADGGQSGTDGMCASPLLKGVPMLGGDFTMREDDGSTIDAKETGRKLSDYIIQGQVISMVMGLVDKETDWNGPEYVAKRVYGIEFMVGSQYINHFTQWNGFRAFELMSLSMPKADEPESEDQRQAREIVESCLSHSFSFKLAHGIILKVFVATLGSLWRANAGSDDVPGSYAHWLRHGMLYWCQDELPDREPMLKMATYKTGPLLRDEA